MIRRLHLLPLIALTVLLLAACELKSTPTPTPTAPPTQPIPLPDNIPASVDRSVRLDPAVSSDPDTLALSSLLYDSLTRLDQDGNPVPALALSWSVSDDQLDTVLTLRQGVTFHDGSPFNADTVLANFNRWFDPADPLHASGTFSAWQAEFFGFKGELDTGRQPISSFDGIEKVDNFTVLIHLNRPVPDLMSKLAQPSFQILDPALLAAAGDTYGLSSQNVNGTGAYILSEWTDSGLTFTPNPAYWGVIPATDLQIGWR
jgi:peptide/nickel transport system substrate-binding protein